MLTDAQIERYSRQIILPRVGGRGQDKLLGGSVAIVGAGGVGSTVAAYLAAAGVGRVGIIDNAIVESADLCRGILHTGSSIGQNRAQSAAAALAAVNPDCHIEPRVQQLTADVAAQVASGYDVVISTENDFAANCLLNAACLQLRKLLLWGKAAGFVAELAAFSGHRPDIPCYRCLHRLPVDTGSGVDSSAAVFAPAGGLIGTVLAIEAIKIILGLEGTPVGRLVRYAAHACAVDEEVVRKDPNCPACGVTAKAAGVAE